MAIRFRKSIKLAPGLRWNISGSGSSFTIGPRGASVGIGKRGVTLNTGIPGTGISHQTRLTGPAPRRPEPARPTTSTVKLSCAVSDDGVLSFADANGAPLPEHIVDAAKSQNREAILALMQRKCDEINQRLEDLARLHHDTPAPLRPTFEAPAFHLRKPEEPVARTPRWLDRLIPGRSGKLRAANGERAAIYQTELAQWQSERGKFDAANEERRLFVEEWIHSDPEAMASFLEERLSEITWPRETLVAFEIREAGALVALDVDLPELEDMPAKIAAVPSRGLKLSVKDLSATKVQQLYAEHVHGIIFRLVGEVFAALPAAMQVQASGYSQRRDTATAQLRDEYLLSAVVQRSQWERIDFDHLTNLAVVDALSQFDLRRDMQKNGKLKRIEPYGAAT